MLKPWTLCAGCFHRDDLKPATTKSVLHLCTWCREELRELSLTATFSGYCADHELTSLFLYSGLMRELILRAKVQDDHRAMRLLIDLAIVQRGTLRLLNWCDVLIASPSSFWGRVRGHLDVAACLAAIFARDYKHPLIPAPWQLHWRLKKRAQMADRPTDLTIDAPLNALQRLLAKRWQRRWGPALKNRKILLIDDVATSGYTLTMTALAITRAVEGSDVKLLTIAQAPRLRHALSR